MVTRQEITNPDELRQIFQNTQILPPFLTASEKVDSALSEWGYGVYFEKDLQEERVTVFQREDPFETPTNEPSEPKEKKAKTSKEQEKSKDEKGPQEKKAKTSKEQEKSKDEKKSQEDDKLQGSQTNGKEKSTTKQTEKKKATVSKKPMSSYTVGDNLLIPNDDGLEIMSEVFEQGTMGLLFKDLLRNLNALKFFCFILTFNKETEKFFFIPLYINQIGISSYGREMTMWQQDIVASPITYTGVIDYNKQSISNIGQRVLDPQDPHRLPHYQEECDNIMIDNERYHGQLFLYLDDPIFSLMSDNTQLRVLSPFTDLLIQEKRFRGILAAIEEKALQNTQTQLVIGNELTTFDRMNENQRAQAAAGLGNITTPALQNIMTQRDDHVGQQRSKKVEDAHNNTIKQYGNPVAEDKLKKELKIYTVPQGYKIFDSHLGTDKSDTFDLARFTEHQEQVIEAVIMKTEIAKIAKKRAFRDSVQEEKAEKDLMTNSYFIILGKFIAYILQTVIPTQFQDLKGAKFKNKKFQEIMDKLFAGEKVKLERQKAGVLRVDVPMYLSMVSGQLQTVEEGRELLREVDIQIA